MWQMRSDQIAADEDQSVHLGLAIVSEQATAIGVTAVPTPATDSNSDLWYHYDTLAARFEFGSSVGFDNTFYANREIDSKAMRKVEEGQDLAGVVETTAVSSGAVVNAFFRVLVKLH